MAEQAETLGVDIFPGFAAAAICHDSDDRVIGVMTGDMGVNRKGEPKENFSPGYRITASYTLLAEGARGFLSQQVIERYQLASATSVQTYGLGIKEVWEILPEQHHPGRVMHGIGWPLPSAVYGGGFLYHYSDHKVLLGLVMALDYKNPHLDPFAEMQRMKLHPLYKRVLSGGRRLAYGARVVNEGGWNAMPGLIFPGGALLGCAAGMLNIARTKGIHNAMWSGILAADSVLESDDGTALLTDYPEKIRHSSIAAELMRVRKVRSYFDYGRLAGVLLTGVDLKLLAGHLPWRVSSHKTDRQKLRPSHDYQPIQYPKADGKITFERMDSLYLANLEYDEDQPVHLQLSDRDIPIKVNLKQYAGPEQRYCPAGVFEYVRNEQGQPYLQINAANCVQCKSCDIKDPLFNCHWVVPEGGSGPNDN